MHFDYIVLFAVGSLLTFQAHSEDPALVTAPLSLQARTARLTNGETVETSARKGNTTLRADGLGAYITEATVTGNFPHVVLGMAVMAFFVVVVNRLFWQPLYWLAERKYRLI